MKTCLPIVPTYHCCIRASWLRVGDYPQLYGIIQGGVFPDLRKEATAFVNKHPFFGIAVGGSLGATKVRDFMAKEPESVFRDGN